MKIRMLSIILAGALLFSVNPGQAESAQRNGFSIEDPIIPLEDILSGGPPRDGIPSIDSPKFVSFRRVFGGAVTTLGVSGLLYNSDLLLYDRKSESLWSQVMGQAVSGPRKGERLIPVPIEHTTWEDWKKQHPQTEVLSKDTGFSRAYGRSPYGDYDENGDIYFPLSFRSSQYHPKERVIGVEFNGEFKAYPFAELSQVKSPLEETFAGQKFTLDFNNETRNGIIRDPQGKVLPSLNAFWFAWYTFHPETEIFSGKN